MNRKMFSFGCAFFGTVALPLLASVRVRSRSDMADVMSLLVVLCLGSCYSVSGMSGGGRLNCEAPPLSIAARECAGDYLQSPQPSRHVQGARWSKRFTCLFCSFKQDIKYV